MGASEELKDGGLDGGRLVSAASSWSFPHDVPAQVLGRGDGLDGVHGLLEHGLGDDGRVVFLDFGLMSTVAPHIMEGFATGIQACLSGDYEALTKVFQDVGFVGTPIQNRDGVGLPYRDATLAGGEDRGARCAQPLRARREQCARENRTKARRCGGVWANVF